ncbi:MAG: UTP--glucose-1-phosphate uridylyltransferase GalU [Synergistaceae bacterium]|nr:UTP--glucose-1-phosphate uridylyltransferase GalU [Synergistaceae bacterium]MBQ6434630.1 UTP--glucose-1-phosphate uridylyltransferase GalU [Synergistaceae bacterium]MBQ6738341.1 UTP--glucose-1-phosphate uridylyltransferase GalU [Synergistaceae bacterium]MBQ7068975.1 UTP--glucose-1-phosphate uridylyltransferase GalU [Synergistaceae bacterium]MBR0075643.1 UTP--glucose-1-phosphate uridylyltransferase GalU [Synergistaceae bacterium]
MKVKKCVFPVAGLGTRFLPVTKELAKEMLPLVNRPIISYGVEEALSSGCDEIVMITGRAKKSIEDYFDRSFELEELLKSRGKTELYEMMLKISNMADILFIRQREPLGLGHAVLCAEPVCKNEFFGVALPDDVFINKDAPILSQLIKVHEKLGGTVIALEEVAPEKVSRYGIVQTQFSIENGIYKISDMIEKPKNEEAPSNLAIMGRYVLSPSIFPILKEQKAGAGGEIQLTDALKTLADQEPVWGVVYKGRRFDCGTQTGWLSANIQLALNDPELRDVVLEVVKNETE